MNVKMMKLLKRKNGMAGWLLGVIIAVVFLVVILIIMVGPQGISEFINQRTVAIFNVFGGSHG